jgi:hypothetical protein
MALPINERARWYLANLHQFGKGSNDWAMPHTWPEVLEPLKAFHSSAKLRVPKPGSYARDYSVQGIVEHYAAGHSFEDVLRAYGSYPKSEHFKARLQKGGRPLATWMSVEVLNVELEEPPKIKPQGAPALKLFAPERSETTKSVAAPPSTVWEALAGNKKTGST